MQIGVCKLGLFILSCKCGKAHFAIGIRGGISLKKRLPLKKTMYTMCPVIFKGSQKISVSNVVLKWDTA